MRFKKKFSPSGFIVLAIMAITLAAPILSPYDPYAIGVGEPFVGPGWKHLMGTDDLGRDLLSRVLYGGRITVFIALAATIIALIIGTLWGMIAGVQRGWVDEILMRTADATMAIPQILFALVCVAAVGASVVSLPIVVGILLSPTTARMARTAVVVELASDYVVAAKATGLKKSRLIMTEVLPNIAPQLLVQLSINAASAVMIEASLSFIGLGIQPPNASWGTLMLQGYGKLWNTYWFVLFPALVVTATILAFNSYGERIRVSLDSRKSSI
ncbi:MAG: ABC transporter permease [Actinomycetes bacterium]|jgi:peptide/nickel transport system permease protein